MDAPISNRLFSGSIRYFLAADPMTSREQIPIAIGL
jgi:hypothetical protein